MIQYALSLHPHLLLTDYHLANFYYAYTLNMNERLNIVDYNKVPFDSIKKGDYLLLNPERQIGYGENINVTFIYTKADYHIAGFVNNPEQHGFILVRQNTTNRLYRFEGGDMR